MNSRTATRMIRYASMALAVASAIVWRIGARAGEDGQGLADAPPESFTEEPMRADPPTAATDLSALAGETLLLMREAQAGFASGRLSDDEAERQKEIIGRLQRLADLAQMQSSSAPAARSESRRGRALPGTNAGDGRGAPTRDSDAEQSSASAAGDAATARAPQRSARDLATSVWGHLPARERDRMQSRFSERFLPQYDRLVRQYYEALATERFADD